MELHLFIMICLLLIPALWAAFAKDLLRSAIALLGGSIGLTLLLFDLNAPIAGVFELSVGAGLITVLFILTISLTRPVEGEENLTRKKAHYKRFLFLPFLILAIAVLLWLTRNQWIIDLPMGNIQENTNVGEILWKSRGLDLLGQIIILLVGAFGVVVLFKRGKTNE